MSQDFMYQTINVSLVTKGQLQLLTQTVLKGSEGALWIFLLPLRAAQDLPEFLHVLKAKKKRLFLLEQKSVA